MAAEKLSLRVVTPDCVKYDAKTDMVIMRCITGDLGIMANHAPYSAILDYGVLRILNENIERKMAVFGGIAQVQDNTVTILTNDAQWPEDIDRTKAEADREEMERHLKENLDAMQIQREQVSMRRTLVQIEVSAYPILSKVEPDDE